MFENLSLKNENKKPRTPKIYNSPNIPYLEVDLKIVLEYLGLIK